MLGGSTDGMNGRALGFMPLGGIMLGGNGMPGKGGRAPFSPPMGPCPTMGACRADINQAFPEQKGVPERSTKGI